MPNSLMKIDRLEKDIKKAHFVSRAFMVASVVVLICTAVISYYIVQVRGQETVAIANLLSESQKLETNIQQWEQDLDTAQAQRPASQLDVYLPTSDDFTGLTRLLDDLLTQWNTPSNPIVSTSLVYGEPTSSDENELAILPVTLRVTSSVENFARLLATLEASGLPGSNFRLIDIQSVALSLGGNNNDSTISYTLSLNAYFQD